MKKLLPLFIFLAACNSQVSDKATSHDKIKTEEQVSVKAGCYVMINGKDSANLQIEVKGDNVTGTLNYNLFEKDRNSGTINGTVKDNLLNADYTFQSEGMTSVRQVVFKINGDSLYEGYGGVAENNDGVRFKDISSLQFHDVPFVKKPCK